MTQNNDDKKDHLDLLIRALNQEALFNPDLKLREKFQKLYELALLVEVDVDDLLVQASGLGLEWFNLRDKTTGHALDDVQFWNDDEA